MYVARLFGIPVKINEFFLLLLLGYAFIGVFPHAIMIFFVVLVHEFFHGLAAKKQGVNVKEVELFPFGGVAHLEYIDFDSGSEFHIALAGPLANFLMAGAGYLVMHIVGPYYWVLFFIRINLAVGLFNLLPALPLDGGRLYRSIKAPVLGLKEATRRASKYGKVIAVFLFFFSCIGVYYRLCDLSVPMLAIFFYLSASGQYKTATYNFIRFLGNKKKQLEDYGAMKAEGYIVRHTECLEDVLQFLKPERYQVFYLVDESGKIVNTVSEEQLINAFFKYGSNIPLHKVK